MSLLRLSLAVTALAVSVVLALTNPTTDQYLGFIQAELTKASAHHASKLGNPQPV